MNLSFPSRARVLEERLIKVSEAFEREDPLTPESTSIVHVMGGVIEIAKPFGVVILTS